MKIIIRIASYKTEAELLDTPTGRAVFEALPLRSTLNRWGDEFYFGIPVHCRLESSAKAEVDVGDLAYWPTMPAFCIFFGPTPVSSGTRPRAASPVNVFGNLSSLDLTQLRNIRDGEAVTVERAD